MKNISITALLLTFLCVLSVYAAIGVKNDTATKYAAEMEIEAEEEAAIAILENDIRILDEEIAKCKKQKKGWIAATVIGSAGVVSTGIAAAVQASKIKDQKETISDKKSDLKDLQQQSSELDKKLDE